MARTEASQMARTQGMAAQGFVPRALRHRSFMIGLVLTGGMIFLALISLVWTPHSATEIVIAQRLKPPSPSHRRDPVPRAA